MKKKKKNKKKLIPLTIRREKWARGGKNGNAMLLNPSNTMCCLGFACHTVGFTKTQLSCTASPAGLLSKLGVDQYTNEGSKSALKLGSMVVFTNGAYTNVEAIDAAIGVNDDHEISDKMREYRLKPILKKLGFEVTFVGDPEKVKS